MRVPKGRGQPVLYLDFDGVLSNANVWWHPRRGAYLRAPEPYVLFQHAALLEEMLEPYPHVRIVLSTSWVLRYRCAGAAKRLPAGLRTRVIGATYHSEMGEDRFLRLSRGEQVTQDVLRRDPGSWLALDDDATGWPAWALPNLLLTDPNEGISPPHLQAALRSQLVRLATPLSGEAPISAICS
ncbi:HAD domain-containing protein [Ramlibacter monticola]|uniref:Uncharacterized protein n=1 Tax=Ramlibacter monticola TaxID=1926872 RepID=A0A937CTX3_9BURK|nr:HAD domain-containing protein [Ramlibacter monticola]MBL0392761.1 hypothetical protein [Ramlibacter monticola]